MRNVINDDTLWFSIIKGISEDFKYKVIDGVDILDYIKNKVKIDLKTFFEQYLYNKRIPIFEYKIQKEGREYVLLYRWNAIKDFNMKLFYFTELD